MTVAEELQVKKFDGLYSWGFKCLNRLVSHTEVLNFKNLNLVVLNIRVVNAFHCFKGS